MKYLITNMIDRNGYEVTEDNAANMLVRLHSGALAECYAYVQLKKLEANNEIELHID